MSQISIIISGLYILTGTVCIMLLSQLSTISEDDVRNGLKYTLLLSSIWAFTEGSKFFLVELTAGVFLHTIGLVTGLLTVFTWLYFASAFSGRSYHMNNRYRTIAVTFILLIAGLKVTNPIHNIYFTAELVEYPIEYVSVTHYLFHDIVTVISYILSFIGVYLFYRGLKMRDEPLKHIISIILFLTIPSVLSLLTYFNYMPSYVPEISFEPFGVAAFAILTLLVINSIYVGVYKSNISNFINDIDNPVIAIDDNDGSIIEANRSMREKFTIDDEMTICDLIGECNNVDTVRKHEDVEINNRHYHLDYLEFSDERYKNSTTVIFSDITDKVTKQNTINRHKEQFRYLADGMSHEIRNGIQIIGGHAEILRKDDQLSGDQRASVEAICDSAQRLKRVSEDLQVLATTGDESINKEPIDFVHTVEHVIGETDMRIEITGENDDLNANPIRFETMCEKIIEFADSTDGTTVHFNMVEDDKLVISSDCNSLSDFSIERAFTYGEAVPSAEVGSILPTVQAIVDSHNWGLEVDESYNGLRLIIQINSNISSSSDTD